MGEKSFLYAMKNPIILMVAVATILRLLLSFVIFPNDSTNDTDNIVARALGPGILPAVGAAISDPVHTWDHLEEACFWLKNRPSSWTDPWGGESGSGAYDAIYTPGTRVAAPPLVVAFFGETLVCPGSNNFRGAIRKLLLLVADAVGALCVYQLGKRIFEMENGSDEEEMERRTRRDEGEGRDDLVVPGALRPERGWVFGLASKIIPPEESSTDGAVEGASTDDDHQKENGQNDDRAESVAAATSTSPPPDREPILALDRLPAAAAVSYYFNPISMLANATGSLRGAWDALLLLSLCYATMPPTETTGEGAPTKIPSATKAAIALASATYVDAGYAAFLLPILLWRGLARGASPTRANIGTGRHGDWKAVLALYVLYLGGIHFLASLLVGGGWSAYGKVVVQTALPNVAFVQQDGSGSVPGPSMGLHWYMFVQVFDRFRPYFTVFVSGIPAMFAVPLMIRLHRYPSVLAATFQLLWAVFRPTATVHTLALGLHLAALNPRTVVRMRDPSLVSSFALPVPVLLFVTFHRMWLVAGNGNPNYVFFQCFAYGMFVTVVSMEFVSATVKRDKVRRMVEKGTFKKLAQKKKEETKGTQKEAEKGGEQDGLQKEVDGDVVQQLNGKNHEKGAEGDVSDQMDDADNKPKPVVVFL